MDPRSLWGRQGAALNGWYIHYGGRTVGSTGSSHRNRSDKTTANCYHCDCGICPRWPLRHQKSREPAFFIGVISIFGTIDSLLPNEDRGESKGRNAQFELFIAAVCQNAGLHPVRREEPDVTCHIEGMKFGIAAKRVKNVDNLRKHIRKAAEQVEGTKLAGVIALDTNVALNRDNERITVPLSDNEFFVLYKSALTRFMDDFHDRIQEWVRGKRVRGLIVHDQQVRFQPDGEWSLVGMTLRVNTARENQRRNREFRLFEKLYTKGLPNIEDV